MTIIIKIRRPTVPVVSLMPDILILEINLTFGGSSG
jgi:hypothetical protein